MDIEFGEYEYSIEVGGGSGGVSGFVVFLTVAATVFFNLTLQVFEAKYLFAGLSLAVIGLGIAAYVLQDWRVLAVHVGAFLVVEGVFWAPAWQPTAYRILVPGIASIYWGVIALLVVGASVLLARRGSTTAASGVFYLGVAIGVLGVFVVGPVASDVYMNEHLADEVLDDAEAIDQLPESDAARSRIAPLEVSKVRAKNSLQLPQYKLSTCDITFLNRTPHWSCALSPNGLYNTLVLQQTGAVYVNQSTTEKDIIVRDDASFEFGVGMLVTDSLSWQLARQDYFSSYREPFVVPYNGTSYLAVPYVDHEVQFKAVPVPQPYTVPRFGGVKLVSEDGTITDLSPEEARSHPVLNNANGQQNFYPYSLARTKVQSISYQHGFLNTLFSHRDQIELSDTPGEENTQPFTVPTPDGPRYFVTTEPWGDANGVIQIWSIHSQTGNMSVMRFDEQSALRSPRKAVDAIMAHPDLARLNDVKPVEPIPVVVDGDLYWQVRIVPESSASITYVGFFNARSEEITLVQQTGDVRAFLQGEAPSGSESPETNVDSGDGGDGDDSSDLVIVIERPDGSTERIQVEEGSSVTIQVPESNSTENATASN